MKKYFFIMIVSLIQIVAITYVCYAATPPNDFLNSNLFVYLNGRVVDGGRATVYEFVTKGLKPGKWSKGDSNQWVYRVVTPDPVKRKNDDVSFSFILAKLAEADGKQAVVLNRIVSNKKEMNAANIYQLFKQIYYNLPSVLATAKESEASFKKDKQLAGNNMRDKLKKGYFGKYNSTASGEISRNLNITLTNNEIATFDMNTFRYRFDHDEGKGIVGANICTISNKPASITFKNVGDNDVFFTAIFEEPGCKIKIEPLANKDNNDISITRQLGDGESSPYLTIEVKGKCSAYCKGKDGFYSLEADDYLKEDAPTKKKKSEDEW